jgi:hypothetical protein
VSDYSHDGRTTCPDNPGHVRRDIKPGGRTTHFSSVSAVRLSGPGQGRESVENVPCPGCGAPVLPGRVFCRPSCKARHEHREAQHRPRLFATLDLESEWPARATISRKVSTCGDTRDTGTRSTVAAGATCDPPPGAIDFLQKAVYDLGPLYPAKSLDFSLPPHRKVLSLWLTERLAVNFRCVGF